MDEFQRTSYAPINRSAYRLAAEATDRYEEARAAVARLINAPRADEVVFTKNATEAINLVASSWGGANLRRGRRRAAHAHGAPRQHRALAHARPDEGDRAALGAADRRRPARPHRSRSTCSTAHGVLVHGDEQRARHDQPGRQARAPPPTTPGAMAIVDACQYVPHNVTDVQAWGADFVAFSSHKMCGPSGIGALWGRAELLDAMPPYIGGGNMIADVRLDGFTCAPVPAKFEAGTPPITEAVGFGAAVEYLESIGMAEVRRHEMELTRYAIDTLNERYGDDITIHGPDNVEVRGGVLSFAFRGIHPHDVSQVLDQRNVCVRAGHHCAKPLMRILGVNATARASLYLYNDRSDVDALADALDGASDIFGF